jgi:Tol biopolymer transport system component
MSSKILSNELLTTLRSFSGYNFCQEKKKIIYLVSQPDLKENKSSKELYIMNADGTEAKLISEEGQAIAEPAFILGGEKIAYIQKGELYIMNIDGSSKKKISQDCNVNKDREGFLFSENLSKLILV